MPGITYTPIDDLVLNSWRNMLAIDCDNSIVGEFTLPTTTGNFSVSFGGGLTWTPTLIVIMGIREDNWTDNSVVAVLHLGAATASNQWAVGIWRDNGSGNRTEVAKNDQVICSVFGINTIDFEASLVSMDSGGFTLNLTDAPTTAWKCAYLAIDLPEVAVGTTLGPGSPGNQSISGLSFAPDAMFVASILGTRLELPQWPNGVLGVVEGGPNFCMGAADVDVQYTSYGGHQSGSNWAFGRYDNAHVLLNAYAETTGSSTIKVRAAVSSWNSNGVTLNFDTAAGTFYYNWILLRGGAVSRFQYPTDSAGAGQFHNTKVAPRGLIGYGNSQTTENAEVGGCSMGVSLTSCDGITDIERSASYQIVSRGAPAAAGRYAAKDGSAQSLGCYRHLVSAGNTDNFMENMCVITGCDLDLEEFLSQIIRYR